MVGGEIGRLAGVQQEAGKVVILNYRGSEQGEAKLGVIWIGMGPYLMTSGIHFFVATRSARISITIQWGHITPFYGCIA